MVAMNNPNSKILETTVGDEIRVIIIHIDTIYYYQILILIRRLWSKEETTRQPPPKLQPG